ncbi:HNH endonuclease signature motif containing protein [Streptomyces sp. PG2]
MTDRNAKRPYDRATLSAAVRACRTWTELMRYLGLGTSGGQRRVLQRKVAAHGIDTSHFTRRSPWRLYSDTVLAEAAASSTTLRETALELGATPAPGTLSHIRRRIDAAGIDISHFLHINRAQEDFPPFTDDELHRAAASSKSIRETARTLGLPEDARSRAALRLALRERHVDTSHFRHARLSIPEDGLRAAVTAASSYADVMRALDLEVNDTNHRRVRRAAARFGLDTGHFTRRARGTLQVVEPVRTAENVLVVLPPRAGRTNRARLHAALREIGVPYQCVSCGNTGQWLGEPITLHIDHINGDWKDNRAGNLRYLCPNCHSLTATWCRPKKGHPTKGNSLALH